MAISYHEKFVFPIFIEVRRLRPLSCMNLTVLRLYAPSNVLRGVTVKRSSIVIIFTLKISLYFSSVVFWIVFFFRFSSEGVSHCGCGNSASARIQCKRESRLLPCKMRTRTTETMANLKRKIEIIFENSVERGQPALARRRVYYHTISVFYLRFHWV